MSDSARVHDRITPCLSELDLRNSGGGGGGRGEGGDGGRGEAVRCASVSPSFGRRAMLRSESDSPGLVARVAFSRNDNCNYKSLLVMLHSLHHTLYPICNQFCFISPKLRSPSVCLV